MNARSDIAPHRAIELVDEFFDGVYAPLEAWAPALTAELGRRREDGLTGSQLTALVKADAHAILDTPTRPLYGAGFCASDAIVREGNPLAWWQGPERTLLSASTFGPGQAAIDLARLEWYRVPHATGARHVAGPFVDYLCSNEITITSALPIFVEGEFAGVACADVLVASLEEALLPQLSTATDATLVNAGGRVVVTRDAAYETGDRFADAEALADDGRVLRSQRYPFALVNR